MLAIVRFAPCELRQVSYTQVGSYFSPVAMLSAQSTLYQSCFFLSLSSTISLIANHVSSGLEVGLCCICAGGLDLAGPGLSPLCISGDVLVSRFIDAEVCAQGVHKDRSSSEMRSFQLKEIQETPNCLCGGLRQAALRMRPALGVV